MFKNRKTEKPFEYGKCVETVKIIKSFGHIQYSRDLYLLLFLDTFRIRGILTLLLFLDTFHLFKCFTFHILILFNAVKIELINYLSHYLDMDMSVCKIGLNSQNSIKNVAFKLEKNNVICALINSAFG